MDMLKTLLDRREKRWHRWSSALTRWAGRHGFPQVIVPSYNGTPTQTFASVHDLMRPVFEYHPSVEAGTGKREARWTAWLHPWGFVAYGDTREAAGLKVLEMWQSVAKLHLRQCLGICCNHTPGEHVFEGVRAGLDEYVCLRCLEQLAGGGSREFAYHDYHGESAAG